MKTVHFTNIQTNSLHATKQKHNVNIEKYSYDFPL